MSGDFFFVIDMLSIAMGVYLVVAPEKACNMGRPEKDRKPLTPKSKLIYRLVGLGAIAIGITFIFLDLKGKGA